MLKQFTQNILVEIPHEMCKNIMKNMLYRARNCEANRGGYLSHIIFNTYVFAD